MTIPPATSPPPNHRRNRILIIITAVFAVLALAWLITYLLIWQFYESTDNAYANGNKINVTSVVSGIPIAFYADETDLVEQGQLLISLDPTPYQVAFEQELHHLAEIVLQVRQLYDNVGGTKAALDSRKTTLERTRYDFENRKKLVSSLAVSNEDYVHAETDFKVAESNYQTAEYQYKMALAAAGNTPIEKHPQILTQQAKVRNAYYNLKHTSIYAPHTGYIAQRSVEVGQYVRPEDYLMAIIPINYVWVDANFKETQLTYMRVGQPATVTLDIYGNSVVYQGKVMGIASGTGSVFSLIPAQNATGNWIKIVQRLPVRILLDPETVKNYPLRLGLSAYATVDISDTTLPILQTQPINEKPIATTEVFQIDWKPVEQAIQQIMEANLNEK